MTTYQNGGPVEGWNDCPPVLSLSKRSSSSSISRRRRAVSHDLNTFNNGSRTPSSASLSPTPPRAPSSTLLPMGTTTPPARIASSLSTSSPSVNIASNPSLDIAPDQLHSSLEKLINLPTKLQQKEFDHYKSKISSSLAQITTPVQISCFINSIESTLAEQDFSTAKAILIQFMLVNEGQSSWCVPLRKLLENVEI